MFTETDLQQFKKENRSIENLTQQLAIFKKGIPFVNVVTAATVGNGVEVYNAKERAYFSDIYDHSLAYIDVVKFVPASGAATRMFAHLVRFVNEYNPEKELINTYLKKKENKLIKVFFESFNDFAFTNLVRRTIRQFYPDYKKMTKGPRFLVIAKTILEYPGLGYSNMPKGLVPFHKYQKYFTTAFEEQLFEATKYAVSQDEAKVHFTFAENHVELFREVVPSIAKRVKKKTKTNFQITYSFQKKETDTIAVTLNNSLVRKADDALLFRPGGHGALIENLNDIAADLVFIKNIDNVVSEKYVDEIMHYKKVLAGKLIDIQNQCFEYLKKIDDIVSAETLTEIKSFIWNKLYCKTKPETIEDIKTILNRPIRVCGVVKNTGAPGGGPYWVRKDTIDSLQIVESAQIDKDNSSQHKLMLEATHFNPVDIVCGLKDYQGNKFNLLNFVDKEAGFITKKTYGGKQIKAMELPGLWNGAMANWNTIFVEVPLKTFNPVKTVNDLLAREHRPLV